MPRKKIENNAVTKPNRGIILFDEEEIDEEDVRKAFLIVEKGTVVRRLKFEKLSTPILVQLTSDHQAFIYKTPKRCVGGGETKRVLVSALLDVRSGWNTDRFMRAAVKDSFTRKVQESCCFSLVHRRSHTLQKSSDFVTETPEDARHWAIALWRLLTEERQAGLHFNENDWLKKNFETTDVDENGRLSFKQVMDLMKKLNVEISEKECKRRLVLSDIHKDTSEDVRAIDFEEFVSFFHSLTKRPALKSIMRKYSSQGVDLWTPQDLTSFLETAQGFQVSVQESEALIQEFEPNVHFRNEGKLSVYGIRLLLLSRWGSIMKPEHANTVFQDMSQPLCNYFINSTHNTYLMGHQLVGNATIEGYIRALRSGARMLECNPVDIWEGDENEPTVTHGFTLVNATPLINVVRAIDAYAFKTSPYPVILSLENHCGLDVQRRAAHIFLKKFGDKIYVPPSSQSTLPSPDQLQYRILLKCKKLSDPQQVSNNVNEDDEFFDEVYDQIFGDPISTEKAKTTKPAVLPLGDIAFPSLQDPSVPGDKAKKKEKVPIAQEFSDLVALKAVKLRDLNRDIDEHPWNSHISLTEHKAEDLVEENLDGLIRYTSRHLLKVYPSMKRTHSTNIVPHDFWVAGIQHVTMNAQTLGEELDLNDGLFSVNNACGYVLKPKWMRGDPTKFHELMKRETMMTLCVQVISGQCLPRPDTKFSREIIDPYVTLEIFGCPCDNQKHKTVVIENNGFNPVWNSEHFRIPLKVPELALLRFCVMDYDRLSANDFVGQYTIPVMSMTPGYSNVPLLVGSQRIRDPSAALFVHVEIQSAFTEDELTGAK